MNAAVQILPPKCTVAVDAMGGDHGPAVVIPGVLLAARLHTSTTFLLFGDPALIEPLLGAADEALRARIEICPASTFFPVGDKPAHALRKAYADSSLALAIKATQEGQADACVTAADTGALMALGMRYLGLHPGIDRPAVASYMPTLKNETVVLDLGANLDVQSKNLLQFGILGTALSEAMLAIPKPRLALLNIGTETTKGKSFLQEANTLLQQHDWPGSYLGFMEPEDLVNGRTDVLICDGYAGNILLKTMEATAQLIGEYTRATFKESWLSSLGFALAARQFAKLRRRTDPRRYNGAVMAGLQKICIKSHGGADSLSFTNALELAIDMVHAGYGQRLRQFLVND